MLDPRLDVIAIGRYTDPAGSTDADGFWWDVAGPAVSERAEVGAARRGCEDALKLQRVGD